MTILIRCLLPSLRSYRSFKVDRTSTSGPLIPRVRFCLLSFYSVRGEARKVDARRTWVRTLQTSSTGTSAPISRMYWYRTRIGRHNIAERVSMVSLYMLFG